MREVGLRTPARAKSLWQEGVWPEGGRAVQEEGGWV